MTKPYRINEQTNLNDLLNTAIKEKPTQKWHEYNLAQTSEKIMFMDILYDICQYVNIRDKKKLGRPTVNIRDVLFSLVLLVYGQKSSRRTISELQIAKDRNFIKNVYSFNTILKYFNYENITTYLQFLINLSSLPLKDFEEKFAVDSSGFTTGIFDRWSEHKYGGMKKDKFKVWRKAHVMSGVYTNIITAVEVSNAFGADTSYFPDLLKKTSKNFRLKEVLADMAYSSRKNFNLISEKGAVGYIPFKRNASGKSRGSQIWRIMYIYFKDHYDEFMQHYHIRSNAESVFSMVKRKLNMNLKTRKPIAQKNEILCKFVAHNILVLISEIFVLGISVEFENIIKKYNLCASQQFCTQNPG